MRRIILTVASLLAVAMPLIAQPAVPGVLPSPAAPSQSVTVANKCCSIFDFLGVKQLGSFLDQAVMKTRLGQAVQSALSPLARAVGLGPSLLSDKFAKEGGAMGLASQLKKEEKKAPLKIQAIKYLGTLDCQCYPEVVDALLDSLEDCNEKVRYEALQALANKCKDKKCILSCLHHDKKSCGTDQCGVCDDCTNSNCPPCDCPGCMCQKKVIDRLNALLLARDEFGCLKEKSERIRALATEMIERCLVTHQPHPGMEAAPSSDEVKPDPEPDVQPDQPAEEAKPQASRGRFDLRGMLPKFFGGTAETGTTQPTVTEPASHLEPIDVNPASLPSLESHTVHYRAPSASGTSIPQAVAPAAGERVIIAPPENSWNGRVQRRHLLGEVFGY